MNANAGDIMFEKCIGIADVKKFQVDRPKERVKENQVISGTKTFHSIRLLSVMDREGPYIFARLSVA